MKIFKALLTLIFTVALTLFYYQVFLDYLPEGTIIAIALATVYCVISSWFIVFVLLKDIINLLSKE